MTVVMIMMTTDIDNDDDDDEGRRIAATLLGSTGRFGATSQFELVCFFSLA